jgi:hypothetical protein
MNEGKSRTLAANVPMRLQMRAPKLRKATFFSTSRIRSFVDVLDSIVNESSLMTGKPVHVMNRADSNAKRDMKLCRLKRNID